MKKKVTPPAETTPTTPVATVVVLSVVYLPRTNQIAIRPQYPAQLETAAVIHVLRRAEEEIIAQSALAQGQAQARAAETPTHVPTE